MITTIMINLEALKLAEQQVRLKSISNIWF